ncbi:MAG TPA: metabolite traffic protein EboE [Longimicrobiales bacterium]
MRLDIPGTPHLTYCTNIHPGESWPEVRANLERYTLAVKARLAPEQPFGVGLRLSARAAEALAEPGELERFRDFLRANGLYVFTINGFPYGRFHGEPVKERVYLPDWLDEARLAYTNRLADLLAALLPEGGELEGTISTVPGAFRARVTGAAQAEAMAEMLLRHAAHLFRLKERTGRSVVLALEPEPWCYLETVEEAIRFFREHLHSRAAVERFSALTGLGRGAAEEFLRGHLGVCLDACHMAVAYEDPEAAVRALKGAGIRIAKAQITAGLQVRFGEGGGRDAERLEALRSFADPVYLHQVVACGYGLERHLDLPQALSRWEAEGRLPRETRIHFHVPIAWKELGPFESTQDYVRGFLALLRREQACGHLEEETYTWEVLPEEYRREGIVEALAGELRWVLDQLRS